MEQLFGDDPIMIIEWVEVPDDYYKGSGVGRAMMNKTIEKIKNLKYKKVYLNASPISGQGLNVNDLVKWYESFGFKTIKDQGGNKLMVLNLNNNIMENYKTIIKESLRTLTEAITHSTKADLYRTMYLVTKANQLYGPNAPLSDDFDENTRTYLNSPNMGQGNIIVRVGERGLAYIPTAVQSSASISKNDLGGRGTKQNYIEFPIRVMPGIEHPEDRQEKTGDAATRHGLTGSDNEDIFTINLPDGIVTSNGKSVITAKLQKPNSPASDAIIKTYLLHGQEIIDYVTTKLKGYNAYTSHNDAAELSKEKMAAEPKLEKHKQRKDAIMALQQHLGRRPLEADIQKYIETGKLPEKNNTRSLYDPEELARREKERQAAIDRLNRNKRK
jgi:hypothetical protein